MADMNQLIMDLRQKTGAGIMDIKKALVETNGAVEEALTLLRKKGLADAAKKSARTAKEGLVSFARNGSAAALTELVCETDFVARTGEFKTLAEGLTKDAAAKKIQKPEDAQSVVTAAIAKLGENIVLRRLDRFELTGPGLIEGYIHLDGKKGAMIQLSGPEGAALSELAKELLLQIVAASPRYLTRQEVPQGEIDKEKEIYTEVLRKEGKPEASIPKIVEGKVNKLFYQASCLSEQLHIRDNKTPVSQLVKQACEKAGGEVAIKRFVRYQLGE